MRDVAHRRGSSCCWLATPSTQGSTLGTPAGNCSYQLGTLKSQAASNGSGSGYANLCRDWPIPACQWLGFDRPQPQRLESKACAEPEQIPPHSGPHRSEDLMTFLLRAHSGSGRIELAASRLPRETGISKIAKSPGGRASLAHRPRRYEILVRKLRRV